MAEGRQAKAEALYWVNVAAERAQGGDRHPRTRWRRSPTWRSTSAAATRMRKALISQEFEAANGD